MADDALQKILTETGVALLPLQSIDSPDKAAQFFRKLGYDSSAGSFGSALVDVAGRAGDLVEAIRVVAEAKDDAVVGAVATLLADLAALIQSVETLAHQIAGASSQPNLDQLPRRLTDYLLLEYLHTQRVQLHEVLYLLGLIDHRAELAAGEPSRTVHWERFGQFFSNPGRIFDDVYRWNTDFDTEEFLRRLERVMRSVPLPGGRYPQSASTKALLGNTSTGLSEIRLPIFQKGLTEETYSQFGITFSPAEPQGTKKKGIALLPYIMGAAEFEFDVCERGELVFASSGDVAGIGVVVRPPAELEGLLNLTGGFRASIAIREKATHAQELILIGSEGGTRLSVSGLGIEWFLENNQQRFDLGFEGEIQSLKLVIAGGEGDGFIQSVLDGLNVQAEANVAMGMSLLKGFTFRGGAQFAIEISTHIDLGPLRIESLRLAVGPQDAAIEAEVGAMLGLNLGPMQAVVENIGVTGTLQFHNGNLGPLDLDVGFKPPNGVGLSIDAGVVRGGGYLFLDYDKGEYAGALELVFSGFLAVKAIGLINTKMPDGSDGFSLVIIVTAEFGTPIQLGFGFTLIGLGGLLGLNRTMMLEALAEGVRSGAVESVMFPRNVVANAPQIISDLRRFFPPEEGTFLIGPMAKLGWGTPTLISASMGVIIEVPPGNIAILGVLKCALPDEDAALLILQVKFIGAIEVDKSRLWFFASLYGSRVVFITLDGDMGLLISWGDDANFVLSVGGFHPRFNPPGLPFPRPQRVSLSILNTPFARIRVEGYFAVTSNTAQFGAAIDIFFGVDAFSLNGHMGFDALFQFSPFYFNIAFSASMSVKVFGFGLFSVRIRGELEGTSPWHIDGEGSISLLFWDISVPISHTWGDRADTVLPEIAAMPILEAEFEKRENWSALPPSGSQISVSLRSIDAAEELVLHPVGALSISQRAVPLGLSITKIGNQQLSDISKAVVKVNADGLVEKAPVRESFATAQYRDLDAAAKLSAPGYEKQPAGTKVSVSGMDTRTSHAVKRIVFHELITIDNNFKEHLQRFFSIGWKWFRQLLGSNATARSLLSKAQRRAKVPFDEKVVTVDPGYVIVNTRDNTAWGGAATFGSHAQASDALRDRVAANPEMAEALHVVPAAEARRAA